MITMSSKPCSRSSSMMCSMHGLPTIGTIGFGWFDVSGRRRVPSPPGHHDCPHASTSLRALRPYNTRDTIASAKPAQKIQSGHCRRRVGDDRAADAEEEQPRRGLADQVHLEPVPVGEHRGRDREEEHVAQRDRERRPREAPGMPLEHDRRPDHQPVGQRIGELAEARLHVPAAREEPVHLVGDPRDQEERPRPPGSPAVGGEDEGRERRNQRQAEDRQRVRQLRKRRRDGAHGHAGRIRTCPRSRSPASSTPIATPSSAPCGAATGVATSGPGATRCSPWQPR